MKEKRETRGPARDEILEYRLSAEHTHAQLNYPSPNKQTNAGRRPSPVRNPYVRLLSHPRPISEAIDLDSGPGVPRATTGHRLTVPALDDPNSSV
jgi:hypothetical protein